ncbi:MAG: hypothetical protein J7M29_09715 [Verrucomicrobia bacterium]|nr:hypothetical protein [Verrucomicrobiota bacterium]
MLGKWLTPEEQRALWVILGLLLIEWAVRACHAAKGSAGLNPPPPVAAQAA